jgi:hypothetical protein
VNIAVAGIVDPVVGVQVVVSGVDIVAALAAEGRTVVVLAFEVDIDSALESTGQLKQSLVQLERACLRYQRHKPYCSDLVVAYK